MGAKVNGQRCLRAKIISRNSVRSDFTPGWATEHPKQSVRGRLAWMVFQAGLSEYLLDAKTSGLMGI